MEHCSRNGIRRRWLACAGVSVLLAIAAPGIAAGKSIDAPRPVRDEFPLQPRDREVSASTAPSVEATSTPEDDTARVALAVALAMLGGGIAAWWFTVRGGPTLRAMPMAAIAGPDSIRVRVAAPPPLWAGAVMSDPEPAAEPRAPLPAPLPGAPAPPDRERAWAAEIGWQLAGDGAQFRVEARPVDGGDEPVVLAASSLLAWPPEGARSGEALSDAVKSLEAALLAVGWTALPRGDAWFARRFSWQPGAEPPAEPPVAGRTRHRELYEAAYARQSDRTRRLRRSIAARLNPEDD